MCVYGIIKHMNAMNYYNNYGKVCRQIFAQLRMRFSRHASALQRPQPFHFPLSTFSFDFIAAAIADAAAVAVAVFV